MEKHDDMDAGAWVERYGDPLFSFALARVSDRAEAEDLVQETFLAAVRGKARYKGQASVKTWLFSIMKHKIIDFYRRTNRTVAVQDFAEDGEQMEAFFNAKGAWQIMPRQWSADPGKAHENREFINHFFSCLSGLPRRTADAFAHREIDGLDTDEICRRLGITPGNCRVILYRARMLLRKCLEQVDLNLTHTGGR